MLEVSSRMADATCGNCNRPAAAGVQYCSGCGQPLWQTCPECRVPALLTQTFCNGCGTNLESLHAKQLSDGAKLLDRASDIAKDGKFKEARRLAGMLVKPPDYRFKALAERAQTLAAEIDGQTQHWDTELPKISERAFRYRDEERDKEVIALLQPIPAGILTPELKALLDNSVRRFESLRKNKNDLVKALDQQRFTDALGCLCAIVELSPTNEKYKRKLDEVAGIVLEQADKYGRKGKFAKAVQLLQTIPANYKDEKFLEKFHGYEQAVFLRLLLAKATYFTPLLPGVIDRLEKLTPGDELLEGLRKKANDLRKRSRGSSTSLWPEWMKPEGGALGIPIVPSKLPAEFPGAQPECIAQRGSQFFIAMGLALQAVKKPMPKGDFYFGKDGPKGIFSIFSKKTPTGAEYGWGIDIGDSAIKAVRLRVAGDTAQAQVDQAVHIPLELKNARSRKLDTEAITTALKKLATEFTLSDQPVLVNFPGNECVTRFNLLPPGAEKKKYEEFVMQDAKANIPLSLDLLMTAYHVSDLGDNERVAPSSIFAAAKKPEVEARQVLCEAAGIKITGVQPEPFAMWSALQAITEIEQSQGGVKPEVDQPTDARMSLADMLIDVGHCRSNILISHPKGIWFRTIDWGLADISLALCSAQKLTFTEAEKMRREPLRATHLQIPIDAMLSSVQVPCREIQRSAYAARDAIGELRLRRVMLVGGGAFQPFLSSWLNSLEY